MKIEKLPSGTYRARVVVGHHQDGRPIRKSFSHYDKVKLRRIIAEYEDEHRDKTVRRLTVGEALNALIGAKKATISPSTMRGYVSLHQNIKNRFSGLCTAYIDEVSKKDVQAVVDRLVEEGDSPKTIRNYHAFLSSAFDLQDMTLPKVRLPQKTVPQVHIPTEDAMHQIAELTAGTPLEIPVALAAFGLRRSEICALSIDDLDGDVIHIHRALVRGADGGLYMKGTKTTSSDRFVRLPSSLADRIREEGCVTGLTPQGLSKRWDRFLKRNKFPPYRFHDLRHFFVSYCHNVLHLSDAQIQAITGHQTPLIMRQNYMHAMNMDASADLVAAQLGDLVSISVSTCP